LKARYALPVLLGIVLLLGSALLIGGCGKGTPQYRPGAEKDVDLTSGPPLPAKTPKPLDVSYIPADAVLALVVDPKQLTESPNFLFINNEGLRDILALDMGISLIDTEQVILIGGLGKKLGEYFGGTILRYKQPVDVQKYLHERSPEWEEVVDGDKKYFRPLESGIPSVFPATDRILVMAAEDTLKRMMTTPKDAESPLLTTLRKSDDAAGALGVLEVASIRPQINAFLAFTKLPAPFDKPPFDGVKQIPRNIEEAIAKFELAPFTTLKLDLRAKDEDAAIATDTLLANIIDKVTETIDEMTTAPKDETDRGAAAQAGAMQGLFGDFKTILKHEREGVNLKLSYGGKSVQNQLVLLGPMAIGPLRKSWYDGWRAQSQENLQKIAAALIESASIKGAFPALATYGPDGKPLLSWRVQLLPLLGQQALYDEFHLDEPWDSEHNKKLIPRMPRIYRTAGQPFDGKTLYVLPTGVGTLFEGQDGPKPDSIADGKDKTILLVEVHEGRGVEWTKPADHKFDRADATINLTHLAKPTFLAAFADGKAREIDAKKNGAIMVGLFSPAGGEEIPAEY
jgi:hypothetical protein